jgi:hypothetical protein
VKAQTSAPKFQPKNHTDENLHRGRVMVSDDAKETPRRKRRHHTDALHLFVGETKVS